MAHRQTAMEFIINTELHQLHRSPAPSEWLANLNRSQGSKPRAAAPRQGLIEGRQASQGLSLQQRETVLTPIHPLSASLFAAQTHEKMLSITHYQRNANQNHNEVPSHGRYFLRSVSQDNRNKSRNKQMGPN